MTLSNVSSVQGSSDKDSKSEEDIDLHEFSNQEHDMEAEYKRLLQDLVRM